MLSASGSWLRRAALGMLLLPGLGEPVRAVTQTMVFYAGTDTVYGPNVVNPPLYAGTLTLAPVHLLSGAWRFKGFPGGMVFSTGRFYTIEFPSGAWAVVAPLLSGGTKVQTTGAGIFGPSTAYPAAGTAYVVREAMTVAGVFGAPPLVGWLQGPLGTGDEIEMPNGDRLFYDSGDWQRWKRVTGTIAIHQGGRPIYFVQGFISHRRGTTNLTVPWTGDVKTTPTWMELTSGLVRRPPGVTAQSLVSTITSVTRPVVSNPLVLATSGLYTGNPATGLLGSSDGSPGTAEEVFIPDNPTGTFSSSMYYDDGSGFKGWFDSATSSAADAVPLPSAVLIKRLRSAPVLIKWNP